MEPADDARVSFLSRRLLRHDGHIGKVPTELSKRASRIGWRCREVERPSLEVDVKLPGGFDIRLGRRSNRQAQPEWVRTAIGIAERYVPRRKVGRQGVKLLRLARVDVDRPELDRILLKEIVHQLNEFLQRDRAT